MTTTDPEPKPRRFFHQSSLKYQLIDSALPTGAFAHSFGIEAAQQFGVLNQLPLSQYVRALLHNISTQDLFFVRRACCLCASFRDDLGDLDLINGWAALDQEYGALLVSEVSRRASAQQGMALLRVAKDGFCSREDAGEDVEQNLHAEKVFNVFAGMKREIGSKGKEGALYGFLAPVFGLVCSLLGLKEQEIEEMYMYAASRDIVSACIRLSLCGPIEAVGFQREISVYCATLLDELDSARGAESGSGSDRPLQTFPLGDVIQGCHSQLFRKMFNT